VVVGLVAVLFGLLFADVFTAVMGRDTTLTGRTALWAELLRMTDDPVLGSGFESFWLGDRAAQLWQRHWWKPNQAHNGYLEIFLNLGWIGVLLLGVVIVRGYRNVVVELYRDPPVGRLKLAYLASAVLYNLTEAAFKGMHLVWIIFFLAVVQLPRPVPALAFEPEPEPDPMQLAPVSAEPQP
jgi:O-antigen ligase